MSARPAVKWVLTFLAAYVVLTIVFSLFGSRYVSMLTPIVAWGLRAATSRLVVKDVSVHGELLDVTFAHTSELTARSAADVTVSGAIQVLYTAPIIALAVISAWPGKPVGRKALACTLALPVLALFPALQFPPLLVASEVGGPLSHTPIWLWLFFVSNGGTQVLAILLAWLAVSTSDRVLEHGAAWTHDESKPDAGPAVSAQSATAPAAARRSARRRRGKSR